VAWHAGAPAPRPPLAPHHLGHGLGRLGGWHLPVFLVVADFREMGWTALGWLVVGVVVHERREVRGAGSRTPRASPSTGSS
jgi:hypothetical protein